MADENARDASSRPNAAPARTRRPTSGAGTRPARTQSQPELQRPDDATPPGPAVVALGGGHGLAIALQAIRRYTGNVTAVVTVADDGGSSGRLRRDLDIPAPGDLRKSLVALADGDSVWRDAFEHRFPSGELVGHALGNLILVGLAEMLGNLTSALDEAGRLLHCVGRVLPATIEPVILHADVEGAHIEGQVAVQNSQGRIGRVELIPANAKACPEAVSAIELADQIVLAPGSLYTSLLSVLCVAGIRNAVHNSPGRVVQVCNLRPQVPETEGLDATDHLRAVIDHDARVDAFLYQADGLLDADDATIKGFGVEPVPAELAASNAGAHDPEQLANALGTLL